MLNFCANNYLGLADHPEVIQAAKDALDTHGFGMASVRFICGTQDLHKQLEAKIADVLRHRGHHSLRRLLRRQRRPVRAAAGRRGRGHFRRAEPRLDHRRHPPVQGQALPLRATATWPIWKQQLQAADAAGARTKLITTDGTFSMDGFIAQLDQITALADEIQRAGAHRRMPLHRLPRRHRPRCGRSPRRDGQDRHLHRHAGQGARRRAGRLHHRPQGSDRDAAPALAPLPVLQLAAAARGGRGDQGVRHAAQSAGDLRDEAQGKHPLFPRADDRGRLRHQAGRASDRAGDDLRREEGAGHGRRLAG